MPQAIPIIKGALVLAKGLLVKGAMAAGLSYGTAMGAATFAMKAAAFAGVSKLASVLSKPRSTGAAERMASQLTLALGEQPRQLVFGRTALAGTLKDAGNWGGQHGTDWECLVIALADHPIDALEGFWVWDHYYPFTANGLQAGFQDGLRIHLQNASPTGAAPPSGFGGHGQTAQDVAAGVTRIFVGYSAKLVEARGSRPNFVWVVRGKRCYDPRRDSTVPGGSGAQRWNNPATWTWSDNPVVVRYNWVRGVFGGDDVATLAKLWIGRGLSAFEAPPQAIFAAANLCDEQVPVRAGGVEKRYTVGGVIPADMPFDQVEARFAEATGGVTVRREGGMELEPGAAKATVVEITDDDLLRGARVVFEDHLPEGQRRNTVVSRYMEPGQRWSLHSAPVRRVLADIIADGGPSEDPLDLEFVNRNTQAQRVGQIRYRQNRRERRAAIVLPARFSMLEEGDWIGWTSNRYHGGGRVTYRVERWSRGPDWTRQLALREIAAADYLFVPATDEHIPGAPPLPEPDALGPLALSGVGFQGVSKGGVPGLRAAWATPVDPAIVAVRVEVRTLGQAQITPTSTTDVDLGVMDTTAGVPGGADIQARLVPVVPQHRTATPSPWVTLTSTQIAAGAVVGPDGAPITGGDILKPRPYAADLIRNVFDDLTGLSAANATIAAAGSGANSLAFTPTSANPYLQWTLGRPGARVHRIRARIRAVVAPITEAMWIGNLTYAIAGSNHALTPDRIATIPYPAGGLPVGAWRDVEWVCDDLIDYLDSASIINVRLRPVTGAAGTLHIGRIEAGYAGGATQGAVLGRDLVKADGNVLPPAEVLTAEGDARGTLIDYSANNLDRPPSWYRENRITAVTSEQKSRSAVGVPGSGAQFGTLTTVVSTINVAYPISQMFEFVGGVWQRQSVNDAAWGSWSKMYDQQNRPAFGSDDLLESGNTVASLPAFKTAMGNAASSDLLNGAGLGAYANNLGELDLSANTRLTAGLTLSGDVARPIPALIKTGSDILSRAGGGVFSGALNASFGAQAGLSLYRTNGSTIMTQAEVRTAEGESASAQLLVGAGTGAYANNLAQMNAGEGALLSGAAAIVQSSRLDRVVEARALNFTASSNGSGDLNPIYVKQDAVGWHIECPVTLTAIVRGEVEIKPAHIYRVSVTFDHEGAADAHRFSAYGFDASGTSAGSQGSPNVPVTAGAAQVITRTWGLPGSGAQSSLPAGTSTARFGFQPMRSNNGGVTRMRSMLIEDISFTRWLDENGRITDGRGLPINAAFGQAAMLNPPRPLSSGAPSDSSINVAATVATLPGGYAISLPSASISGLAAATAYSIYRDLFTGTFVAVASGNTAYRTSTDRYLYIGVHVTAQTGGGSYPPPPPLPPGGGGGWGGDGDYTIP